MGFSIYFIRTKDLSEELVKTLWMIFSYALTLNKNSGNSKRESVLTLKFKLLKIWNIRGK
jgi:hypothetical protein